MANILKLHWFFFASCNTFLCESSVRLWALCKMKKNMWDNAGWATEKSSGATSWTSHTCLRKPMNQIAWHSCITQILKHNFPTAKKRGRCKWTYGSCLCVCVNFTGSLLCYWLCILQAISAHAVYKLLQACLTESEKWATHFLLQLYYSIFHLFKMNIS